MPKAKGNPPCRTAREGIGHDNQTLRRDQCSGHQYVAQYSVSLTNKKESLGRSECQGLSQGQAVDNHWLNYSVLGLSFRVGLVLVFFSPFCFQISMAEGPRSVPFTTCCCSSSNKERGAPPLAGPGGRAGPRRPAQPDAFVYYGSTRRAGRRPGLRGRAGTGSRGRAPGARPRLPCWGRGGWALRDAFLRHGHQIGTLPPDERGQVTTSSTSSVQGSSAKLVKPSLS